MILVNCIYDIEDVTHENIKAALADYKSQRVDQATFQMNNSRMIGRMMYGQVRILDLAQQPNIASVCHQKN